jgi:hypothetical protein
MGIIIDRIEKDTNLDNRKIIIFMDVKELLKHIIHCVVILSRCAGSDIMAYSFVDPNKVIYFYIDSLKFILYFCLASLRRSTPPPIYACDSTHVSKLVKENVGVIQ